MANMLYSGHLVIADRLSRNQSDKVGYIADMLYSGHLVIADRLSRNQSDKVGPLYGGYAIADTLL